MHYGWTYEIIQYRLRNKSLINILFHGNIWFPVYLSIIFIAFVGHAWAAITILSRVSAVSDWTLAFGLMCLLLSTTNTFGAMVSHPPNAKHKDGSIRIWNLLLIVSRSKLSWPRLVLDWWSVNLCGFNLFWLDKFSLFTSLLASFESKLS